MSHCVLIADSSSGRMFLTDGHDQPLRLRNEYRNPQGRMRTQDLTTDGPGRLNKSAAPGTRSATAPHTSAHDEAAERFAHELAAALQKELERGSYRSLAIAAPPHFLGLLRPLLSDEVRRRLIASIPRDLVDVPVEQLASHIDPLMPPGTFT